MNSDTHTQGYTHTSACRHENIKGLAIATLLSNLLPTVPSLLYPPAENYLPQVKYLFFSPVNRDNNYSLMYETKMTMETRLMTGWNVGH